MFNINKSLFTFTAFVVFFWLLGSPVDLSAQELVGAARSETIQKINQAALRVKGLTSRFTQTKQSTMLQQPIVKTGEMNYKAPNRLRWEYLTPEKMAIVLQGDSVFIEQDGTKRNANNRMMKGITSLVMGCVSGHQLFSDTDFRTTIFDEGHHYRAELIPLRKDIQRMFAKMTLMFNKASYTITEVRLQEKEGDCTTIQFQYLRVQ